MKIKKIKIDEMLKNDIKSLCEEECQVIVHCSIFAYSFEGLRIWKNTNLIDHHTGKKSILTHAENIPFYPQAMVCERGQYHFTLFFKGLPKNCEVFDLFEDIPEYGGFLKKNIQRNSSDVYQIKL